MIRLLLSAIVFLGLISLASSHLSSVETEFSRQLLTSTEQQHFLHEFKNFSLSNTDPSGKVSSVIQSPHTEFIPAQQETLMATPEMTMQNDQGSPTTLTANSATVIHEKNITVLEKNVIVHLSKNNQKDIKVNTEKLILNNTTQTATTDLPASIFHGNGEMHGTGLKYNPKTQQITFLNNVRGYYKP